jgi:bifunctional ADP-heptose synthase (sugar kinase/adenylyltransferase)
MSQIIQQLESLRILLIGDVCSDIFKYGKCERLSPEAPVPVFKYNYEIKTEGMAGNVKNNLLPFRTEINFISSKSKTEKIRYIDLVSNQHLLRQDIELPTDEINVSKIQDRNYDAVIISDYDKGFLTHESVKKLIKLFKCPIFVDSKKNDLSCYEGCILKLNEKEFKNVIKFPDNYQVITTLGSRGAVYKNEIFLANKVQIFDVSGAGDTFLAGLVVKYLLTRDLKRSIKFANFCASKVVQKSGTAVIKFEEVYNELCI